MDCQGSHDAGPAALRLRAYVPHASRMFAQPAGKHKKVDRRAEKTRACRTHLRRNGLQMKSVCPA